MDPETSAETPTRIDLYWRPGCGFCSMLRRRLDQLGVERVEHDIWDDPSAADVVRQHARGNETVPTVVVGDVGLVNPSADEVVDLVRALAPQLLPDDLRADDPANGPIDGGGGGAGSDSSGPVGRFVQRVLGG